VRLARALRECAAASWTGACEEAIFREAGLWAARGGARGLPEALAQTSIEIALSGGPRRRAMDRNDEAYELAEKGKDLDRAMDLAGEALAACPLDPAVLDTVAWIFHKRGDDANALRTIRKAIKRPDGDASEIKLHAAAILESLGRRDAARYWAEAAAKTAEETRQ
ncbi:MAG: hypothetical protein IJ678_05740, partial [Kiritimatiellae bacterium]|nr:hypothetical protein [Kiritimatiellia bacterium]